MPKGGRRVPGPGKSIGRPREKVRLTVEEFEVMVQEQNGMCALCSEPGSAGGLVVDTDQLRKKIRGLLHPKCKVFLALGRDNPLRFQMAITYLEQKRPRFRHRHGLRQITPFQNPPESNDANCLFPLDRQCQFLAFQKHLILEREE